MAPLLSSGEQRRLRTRTGLSFAEAGARLPQSGKFCCMPRPVFFKRLPCGVKCVPVEILGFFCYDGSTFMETISPRQESILNRVVETHIQTALPVGSQMITDLYQGLYRGSYSSATVRHEMGCLEEMGYLMHPHTSAGRIPTDRGYRYYVDHSLQQEVLEDGHLRQLETDLAKWGGETNDFAEQVSQTLSNLTGEVSVCMQNTRVYVQGSSRLLEKPEFQSVEKIHIFLKALEEKETLAQWVTESAAESGVSVKIGRENRPEAFRSCAIVSARYSRPGGFSGTIAVFGPQRMKYSRAVPIVFQISRMIARILDSEEDNA